MKFIFVFAVLIVCTLAAPRPDGLSDDGLIQTNVRDDSGQYAYSYQTKSGSSAVEQGSFQDGRNGKILVKTGAYSYYSPDGKENVIRYRADEDGFHLL